MGLHGIVHITVSLVNSEGSAMDGSHGRIGGVIVTFDEILLVYCICGGGLALSI